MTKQEYTKQVVKYLNCSSEKKREIRKQLDSDIDIALSEGRQLEEILTQMGSPETLAGEFNENFGEESPRGKKTGKKRNILAIILGIVLLVILAAALFIYWALPKERDISDSKVYAVEEIQSQTERIINLFSEKDYQAMEAYMIPAMVKFVQDGVLEEARLMIREDWGEMRDVSYLYMAEIRQFNQKYAVVVVNVTYDHVNVTFTLSFDEEMQLEGFWVS